MYVAQVPATGAVTGKALSALGPWQAEDPPLSERRGLGKALRQTQSGSSSEGGACVGSLKGRAWESI